MDDSIYVRMRKIADILQWYPEELQSEVFDFLIQAYFPEISNYNLRSVSPISIGEFAEEEIYETDDAPDENISNDESTNNKSSKSTSRPKKNVTTKTYYPDTSLNLKGDKSTVSFQQYCADFIDIVSNKVIFATVATYYLTHEMNFETVNMQQIMSCFKEMSVKPYKDFRQVFRKAKADGYLNYEDDNVELTQFGINLIEHDLEKASENSD